MTRKYLLNFIIFIMFLFCYGCLEKFYVKKTKYQIQEGEGQIVLKGDLDTAYLFATKILEENKFKIISKAGEFNDDYRIVVGVIDTYTDAKNRATGSILTGFLGGDTKKVAEIVRKERKFVIKARYDEFDKIIPNRIGVIFTGESYEMNAQKNRLRTVETMTIDDRDNVLKAIQKRIEDYYKSNNKKLD